MTLSRQKAKAVKMRGTELNEKQPPENDDDNPFILIVNKTTSP